jgi:hypothetical protein
LYCITIHPEREEKGATIAPAPTPRYNPTIRKEKNMAEQTAHTRKPFEGKIPEDARQHFRAAREELHKTIEDMVPPEFMEHRRKARKEMLLAWRSMIDASLERMDEKKKKA